MFKNIFKHISYMVAFSLLFSSFVMCTSTANNNVPAIKTSVSKINRIDVKCDTTINGCSYRIWTYTDKNNIVYTFASKDGSITLVH